MRLTLVVNPTASTVTPEARAHVEEALGAAHDLTVVETEKRDDATPLAATAAAEGAEVVVVLGGDGTYNEAANGLLDTETALAVLPGGSTNVFARTIGLANDVEAAIGQVIDALSRGSRRRIGMGVANGRSFLFHCGVGFDAAVVEQVEKRGNLKRKIGQAVFVIATVATFRTYDRSSPPFSVRFPGEEPVDSYFALFLASNPYTYLGKRPFNVAPDADFDRGLAGLAFKDLRLSTLAGAARAALGSGRKLDGRHSLERRAELGTVTVTGHRPFRYQTDGDYLGTVDSLELRHQPACLDLVVP